MKKYIIFAISFLILHVILQTVSGYILTLFHDSDIARTWIQEPDTVFYLRSISSINSIVFAFIAATIAFFIPMLFIKDSPNN